MFRSTKAPLRRHQVRGEPETLDCSSISQWNHKCFKVEKKIAIESDFLRDFFLNCIHYVNSFNLAV